LPISGCPAITHTTLPKFAAHLRRVAAEAAQPQAEGRAGRKRALFTSFLPII
jgi:hypothetical protein